MIEYTTSATLHDFPGETLEEKLRAFVDSVFEDKSFMRCVELDTQRALDLRYRNGKRAHRGKERRKLKWDLRKIKRGELP